MRLEKKKTDSYLNRREKEFKLMLGYNFTNPPLFNNRLINT